MILSRSSWPIRITGTEDVPKSIGPVPHLLVRQDDEMIIDLSRYIKESYNFRHKNYNLGVLFAEKGYHSPLLTLRGIKPGETLLEAWALNRWGEGPRQVFFILVAGTALEPPADLNLVSTGVLGELELHYERSEATHNHLFTLYRQQEDGSYKEVRSAESSISPAVFGGLEAGQYGVSARSCHDVRRVYCERAEFSNLLQLP